MAVPALLVLCSCVSAGKWACMGGDRCTVAASHHCEKCALCAGAPFLRQMQTAGYWACILLLCHIIANSLRCVRQVRWYSFQFLCQQLSDELLDMHERMAAVLSALPKPPKPPKLPPHPRGGLHEPLLPT